MDEIYRVEEFEVAHASQGTFGKISEKEKFIAAKQILLGIAILYVITLFAYLYKPVDCAKLIDICTTTFPPLATLIMVSYFRERGH